MRRDKRKATLFPNLRFNKVLIFADFLSDIKRFSYPPAKIETQ